jgi:16S rRNA A1518/A1519 N6-dimethyltransferase RsmA/KsgA/DIM1 with predicted DNA glycosylase/AP lyase activity
VPKTAFDPKPRTNWEIVLVTKKPNPLKTGQLDLYLKQYFLEHPRAKVKNSLMEVVIRVFASMGKKLTKNQAREVIAKAKIKKELLENLPRETISYRELAEKLSAVYSCIDT